MTAVTDQTRVDAAVADLVRWLETGEASGTFADDCFADISLPHWRVQTGSAEELMAARRRLHPAPGRVHVERVDRTDHGFAIAFEERWRAEGQDWYARELIRADVDGAGRVVDLAVYCTGDWDEARQAEHAADVVLLRP
jgi:hypothetical protein